MVLLNYTVGIYGVVITIILSTNAVLLPTTTVFFTAFEEMLGQRYSCQQSISSSASHYHTTQL